MLGLKGARTSQIHAQCHGVSWWSNTKERITWNIWNAQYIAEIKILKHLINDICKNNNSCAMRTPLIFITCLGTLATWCKEMIHLKRPWCWERLKAGGAGDDREWESWMASPTRWTWVWADREACPCCSPWGHKE